MTADYDLAVDPQSFHVRALAGDAARHIANYDSDDGDFLDTMCENWAHALLQRLAVERGSEAVGCRDALSACLNRQLDAPDMATTTRVLAGYLRAAARLEQSIRQGVAQ